MLTSSKKRPPVLSVVRAVLYVSIISVLCSAGCIDTVTKNPVSKGGKIVCRVDAGKCIGCGLCVKACPYDAIIETQLNGEWFCFIDPDKCTGCGECIPACEDDAIRKIEYSGDD